MTQMKFGDRTKKIRKEKKITKAALAAHLGMTERMLSYYEKGDFTGEESRIEKYESKLSQLESGNFPNDDDKKKNYLSPEATPEIESLIKRAEEKLSGRTETIIKGRIADALLKSNEDLSQTNKILRDIIQLGIKAGAIKWIGEIQIDKLG